MYPAQETTTSCTARAYTASAASDAASGSHKRSGIPAASASRRAAACGLSGCGGGGGGGWPAHEEARFAHREYTPRCCATHAPA